MPDKPLTITAYAAGASLAAIALVYVFGPTFFLDDQESRSSRRVGVVGLVNPANDCFINSVLQALAGLPDLRVYLIKELHKRKQDPPETYTVSAEEAKTLKHPGKAWMLEGFRQALVTQALKDILDRLNERPIYRKTISASEFIRSIEYAYDTRISRRQQDAQELLQILVERLGDEYHAGVRARRRVAELNAPLPEGADGLDKLTSEDDNLIANGGTPGQAKSDLPSDALNMFPFEGKLESHVECLHCHFKPKPSVSTFVTLTLNVPQTGSTTLDACFDMLLKQELIDDYRCDKCWLEHAIATKRHALTLSPSSTARTQLESELATLETALHNDPEEAENLTDITLPAGNGAPKRRISKHTRIAQFPKTLALHLSRSIFDRVSVSSKNLAKVAFPETLQLGGLDDRREYRLTSLVAHQGVHHNGHYETFRRQVASSAFAQLVAHEPGAAESRPSSRDTAVESPGLEDEGRSLEASSAGRASAVSASLPAQGSRSLDGAKGANGHPQKNAASRMRRRRSNKHDRWWRISDEKIKECDTYDVLGMQKECYLLFYEIDVGGQRSMG